MALLAKLNDRDRRLAGVECEGGKAEGLIRGMKDNLLLLFFEEK